MMDLIHICMMTIDIGPNISSVCLLLWGQGFRFKHHRCVFFFFFFFFFFFSFPSVLSQWTPQAKGDITFKNNGIAKYFGNRIRIG